MQLAALAGYFRRRREVAANEGDLVPTEEAETAQLDRQLSPRRGDGGDGEEPPNATAAEDGSETPRDKWVKRKRLLLSIIVLAWFTVGALLFSTFEEVVKEEGGKNRRERLGLVRGSYLMVQIITTVGYGDFVPESQFQKIACTVVVLTSTLLVANIVMDFISDMEDKVGDGLADDMNVMTHKIRSYVDQEQRNNSPKKEIQKTKSRRDLVDTTGGLGEADDSPKEMLVKPNQLALQQEEERWKRTLRDLSISTGLFVVCLVVGVVFFKVVDGCNIDSCKDDATQVHTWADALYMSVMTMTTVGFGDVVPKSRFARCFATLWMVVGVAVTVKVLGNIGNVINQAVHAEVQDEMTRQLFLDSDQNVDGYLDEMEFLQLQFVKNGLASKSQFDAVRDQFKLIAGSDNLISLTEYASFFLPEESSRKRKLSKASEGP